MQAQHSPPLGLRAHGPLACFTRPELKVERVSYPVMTPSAARGLIEAVLWKPAIQWRIERIKVLKPAGRPAVEWVAFRRNEVGKIAATPAQRIIDGGGHHEPLSVEHERQQRNTVALRDVDYVIEARFTLTDAAGPGDNVAKFVDMFRRRLEKGQHFHQPYLGCREFVADVQPVDDQTPEPRHDYNDELGLMLWDIAYPKKKRDKARPIFFAARIEQGVLEVPVDPEATLTNANDGETTGRNGGGA